MLPDIANFADIRSPQLEAHPALKALILRLLLTEGASAGAIRRYRDATGASREEAEKAIGPLEEAIRARRAGAPIRPNGKTTYTPDDLDDINWWALDHAHGAATDVPHAIRALLSGHPSIRAEALDRLFHTIAPHGYVYNATAVAAPFLIELVRTAEAPDRDGILHLLDRIALSHVRAVDERSTPEHRPITSADGERAFSAVRAGIPVYLDLLDDPLSGLQRPALRLLCRFRDDADRIVPHIRRLLQANPDRTLLAPLVFSLSYSDIRDPWAVALCDRLLGTGQVSVRTLAAATSRLRLAPTRPSPAATRVLATVAAYPHRDAELSAVHESALADEWPIRPSTVLAHAAEPAALAAAPILLAGLAACECAGDAMGRWHFHDLARTIISMLFTNATLPQRAGPPLAAARAAALRAIIDHPCLSGDPESVDTLRVLLPAVLQAGTLDEDQAVLRALLRNAALAIQTGHTHAIEMARQLLAHFFAPDRWHAGTPAWDLTGQQRAILEAIAGSGYWRRDHNRVPDQPLEDVLRSFNLPETVATLRAYLASTA